MSGQDYQEPEGDDDLLREIKDRLRHAQEDDEGQRALESEDLRMCDPETQWPDAIRAQRDAEERPCLSIDRLGPFVNQVVNEWKQARPQPQVNPVGDGASKETAEILQGMIRHIMYMSSGQDALDTAYKSMIRCGRGYFRVLTEYCNDKSFDQDIVVRRIPNHFLVYLDPSSTELDGSDAEWGAVISFLSADAYKAEYPNTKMAGLDPGAWQAIAEQAPEWILRDGAGCTVVEYYKKTRKRKKLYLLQDGQTTDEKPEDPEMIKDSRWANEPEIKWYKVNALEVMEETVWPGKYIPIVPMYGTELIQDGKRSWAGLIRSAKDAQIAYNYWKTSQAETIALAPRTPWLAEMGSLVKPELWQQANRRSIGVLFYRGKDDQGNPVQRPARDMAEPPIRAITEAMIGAVDDLKASTGMYDPSLGNREAAQSGVAIRQLQRQGQSGNYHFQDAGATAVRMLGQICVDLMPKVYDAARVVKIVKPDDTTDMVQLNAPTKDSKGMERLYDPSMGTYDVTISVGPSYQTKRQENLALMESLMQGPLGQVLSQVAPDLVASVMDFAIAPQLVERLKKILPPQLRDEPTDGQTPMSPEMQQMMQQVQEKDQQDQQMIEQLTQALNKAHDEMQSGMAKAKLESETKLEIARIQAQTDLITEEMKIAPAAGMAQAQQMLEQLASDKAQLEQALGALLDELEGSREEPGEMQEQPVEQPTEEMPALDAGTPMAAPSEGADPYANLPEGIPPEGFAG